MGRETTGRHPRLISSGYSIIDTCACLVNWYPKTILCWPSTKISMAHDRQKKQDPRSPSTTPK